MLKFSEESLSSPLLITENQEKSVVYITLNRPNAKNAFTRQMLDSLHSWLLNFSTKFSTHPYRAVVLKANGEDFCAGADLSWMAAAQAMTPEENKADATVLADVLSMLSNLPIPTLAEVKGRVIGGGLGLIATVDVAIGAENFIGKFSESLLGLIPATIAPHVVRAIGDRAARALFLTAKSINAKQGVELGLLHEVVSIDKLSSRCDEILNAICACGPDSQIAIKEQLAFLREELELKPFNYIQRDSVDRLAKIRVSAEAEEGIRAFVEKRPPVWQSKTDKRKA